MATYSDRFLRAWRALGHCCASASVVLCLGLPLHAHAVHLSRVIDNHPAGGPGATFEEIIVPSLGEPGSPLFEGPEAPGVPHLHGPWIGLVATGHPDPHTLHPDHFLGHGIGEPIVHTGPGGAPGSPPGGGSGSPGHDHDHDVRAPRDVGLREIVIPLGTDHRTTDEGAELAAFFGQAGLFETLFVERRPLPVRPAPLASAAAATASVTDPAQAAAVARLTAAQQAHATELAALAQKVEDARTALLTAQRDKAIAQANLTAHTKDEGAIETASRLLAGDARTTFLDGRITDADGRIRAAGAAFVKAEQDLAAAAQRFADEEAALALAVTKADPALRAAEEDRRYAELIELNQEFAIRSRQFHVSKAEFVAHLDALDGMIASANQQGWTELAAEFAEDKQKIETRLSALTDFMVGQSAEAARALNAAYARNATEELGPANGDELVSAMETRGDIGKIRFDVSDQRIAAIGDSSAVADDEAARRVAAARDSARAQALGARNDFIHVSIFSDPLDGAAWRDYAWDNAGTVFEYAQDPTLFAERYASYAKGSALAVKDGLVDLAVLGVELVDTNLELQQATLNAMFGTNIDIVGSENLQFLQNTAAAAAQLDSNAFFTTADRFLGHFERRFEQMAGSGEQGIRQALEGTGYVFTTIVGGEEIAFRAIALGAKGVKIVRLGRADEVLEAGQEIAQAGDKVTDASRTGVQVATDAPPSPTPGPAAVTPPARGPPLTVREGSTGGSLATAADGQRTLTTPDGQQYAFGERLGGGGTSTAFAVPGRTDIIVKETAINADNVAGAVFDRAGYKVLDEIDPSLAPRQIGDPVIIDGKQYAVFERADSYQEMRFKQAQAQGLEIPTKQRADGSTVPDKERIDIEMSAGQAAAYKVGIGKLNDRGYVFMDNKIDNWALVKTGEPDQWEMKIIDPGSIVKLTDANAARRLQAKIDMGDDGLARIYLTGNKGLVMGGLRQEIMQEFDEFIDVAGMEELGVPITSFSQVPYNPVHGFQNPSVRQIFDVDIAAMTDGEFAEFLRTQGWNDAQIDEIMDLPPQLRAQSARSSLDLAAGTPASGGDMGPAEFREYLRRQDPEYWTEQRLDEYMNTPPPPNPWADEVPDFMDDEVPTAAGGPPAAGTPSDLREAVTEIDAENAVPPSVPPRISAYLRARGVEVELVAR